MTDEERMARVRAKFMPPAPSNKDIRHPDRRKDRHAEREKASRASREQDRLVREKRVAHAAKVKAAYQDAEELRARRVSIEVVEIEHRIIDQGEWREALADLGYESYGAYLASRRWEAIRTRVMWEQRRTCQYCGERATEVHHELYTYENLSGLDREHLKAACRGCHRAQHGLPPS